MDRKEVVLGMAELIVRLLADDMSVEGARQALRGEGVGSTAPRTVVRDCLGSADASAGESA